MPSVKIAYQTSTAAVATNWNVTDSLTTGLKIASMIDRDTGVATGWSLSVIARGDTRVSTGLNSIGSGDAAWVENAIVSQQNISIGGSYPTAQYRYGGLDNTKLYDLEVYGCYSSASGAAPNVLEASTDNIAYSGIETRDNTTQTIKLTGVSPSSGNIDLYFRLGSGSTTAPISAVLIKEVAANQDPTLDTPQADVTIQEGQTGTIDCGANFSDANAGDTLTYSISPDIGIVTGFSFNTATGVITYNGSQVAATAVSYTVTADDGNGGTPATDTFTITVTAPELVIDAVSTTTPEAGSTLTFNISNKQGTISASCSAGTISIVSQDATTVVVTVPNPVTFGSKTLNFNTNVTVTLDDGTTTATQVIQITPQTGTQTAEITTIDADGIYANDVGVTTGMFSYAYNFTGDVLVDLTDGLVAAGSLGGSFRYMIYDGVWGDYAPVSFNQFTTNISTQTIDITQWTVGSGGLYRGNDKQGNL